MAEKDLEEEHQTTAHTAWRICWMLENLLSVTVWTANTSNLIAAVAVAGVVFQVLQPLKLPATERLPFYLLSCVVCRFLVEAIPPGLLPPII